MMQRIEDCLLGRLNPKEIDELWIEFMKDPEWLPIMEIEAALRKMAMKMG